MGAGRMEFQVLGTLEVRKDGRARTLSGRLQRILLGVLLSKANQPVPVDTLTHALWGDRRDPRAGQKLQLHVHRLRAVLGDRERLSLDSHGYRLRVLPAELDAERFESAVDQAKAIAETDPQRAVRTLRAALETWRGTPFADLDVPALDAWDDRLTERRLAALETLYEAELACGLDETVIEELADLTRRHPLRERLHGLHVTALSRAGRRPEALEACRAIRDTFTRELGVEPGPELRELERHVVSGDSLGPERATVTGMAVPAQLPADVPGFVGREAELGELDRLLSAGRRGPLAAVVGTAGAGKTALVVRWAHRARERFPEGQLYADLRGYGPGEPVEPGDVLAGFLRALGVDGARIPGDVVERSALFRTLVDKRRMLLVLDNARTAEQVRPLLPGSSSCLTLVTSRNALAGLVAREVAHRVSLGRLSEEDAEALLRATIGDQVDADPGAARILARRCTHLPLALRIAAELVAQGPGGAGELAAGLGGEHTPLDLLDLDGDPHTAVRTVFSWSYRQLDAPTATVFRLLGSYPGRDVDDFAVAAMAATGVREARRALEALARSHLVERPCRGRYQPHDLLRAYAAELAHADGPAEQVATRDRLLDYYVRTASAAMNLVTEREPGRRSPPPAPDGDSPAFGGYDDALRWLDTERDNLLAAARQGGPDYLIALSEVLWRYLDLGGHHHDALALHAAAAEAARGRGDTTAEANALRMLGTAAFRLGDHHQAVDHLERALDSYRRAGDLELQAATLNNLGSVLARLGEDTEAQYCYRQALLLYSRAGRPESRAPVLNNLAWSLLDLGKYDEARSLFEQALPGDGDRAAEAGALCGLAQLSVDTGHHGDALAHARRALAIARALGHRSLESLSLRLLGAGYRGLGDHDRAAREHRCALAVARVAGDAEQLAGVLTTESSP